MTRELPNNTGRKLSKKGHQGEDPWTAGKGPCRFPIGLVPRPGPFPLRTGTLHTYV